MNRRQRPSRGAALLLAMVILTLVSTLAAGMVWQQWRATEVETAERARAQAVWILNGALDWARLILREDKRADRSQPVDHLGEPWAVPLAEARLSTFLAADRSNTDESDVEAFLSGSIEDAQSRYNLRNLVKKDHTIDQEQVEMLQRLCAAAGLSSDTAVTITAGLRAAWAGDASATVEPRSVAQLTWLGIDAGAVQRLAPWIVLLPTSTPLNLNTAPREVMAAVLNLDVATTQRLVQQRERNPFKSIGEVQTVLGPRYVLDPARDSVTSDFFIVHGRLRLGERVLEEESLVQRRQLDIVPLRRERSSVQLADR